MWQDVGLPLFYLISPSLPEPHSHGRAKLEAHDSQLEFLLPGAGEATLLFPERGLGGSEVGVWGLIKDQELGGQVLPQGIWHFLAAPV